MVNAYWEYLKYFNINNIIWSIAFFHTFYAMLLKITPGLIQF